MSAMKFLFEEWVEKAEYEMGAPMDGPTQSVAMEYFLEGAEPWEFANAVEESWLATMRVG